jgi:hypothetical protein
MSSTCATPSMVAAPLEAGKRNFLRQPRNSSQHAEAGPPVCARIDL